jgi:hypothetical protein
MSFAAFWRSILAQHSGAAFWRSILALSVADFPSLVARQAVGNALPRLATFACHCVRPIKLYPSHTSIQRRCPAAARSPDQAASDRMKNPARRRR